MSSKEKIELRCPTKPTAGIPPEDDILGCGSTNLSGPDSEGLYDCLECGIWFPRKEAEGAA